jgi:diguanylate cyclase (GGDEF)-like protein/PAS domain S-box-containing protein
MTAIEGQLNLPAQGGPGEPPAPSRSVLSGALEAMGQAIAVTDSCGAIRFWSSAAEQLYGYRAAEAVGRDVYRLIGVSDPERVRTRVLADLSTGEQSVHECAVHGRDGRSFGVVLTARQIATTGDPADTGSLLLVSREELSEGVITTDASGIIRWATASALRLYGYEDAGLAGRDIRTLVPEDLQDELGQLVQAVMGGVPVELPRTQRVRGDGSTVTLGLRVTPLRDDSGAVVGMSCRVHDLGTVRAEEEASVVRDRRYRARFEQTALPQMVLDLEGRVTDTNDAMCRLVGLDRSQLLGRSTMQLHHPSDVSAGSSMGKDLFAGRLESAQWERLFARADGSPVPLLISSSLVRDEYGTPDSVHAFCQDLTLQRKAEHEVRSSEARYRAIAETAQEAIWVTDPEGRTLFANSKAAEIFGVTAEHLYATTPPLLCTPDNPGPMTERLRDRATRGLETYELPYAHPDGTIHRLRASVSPMIENGLPASLAMISDVTAQHAAEEQLRSRALHDELTGLPNRTLMSDRIGQALARQARSPESSVAVLLADLDDFKLVNDTWGHAAGDDLLRQVAQRLQQAVRTTDTVARFGGDEFVILCENVTVEQAQEVAARVVDVMRAAFEVHGQPAYVAASIGIALSPPADAATLLQYADTAMYEAKSHGRNQIRLFDVALAQNAADHLLLGNDLRTALDTDQLQMFYQPVVQLEDGQIVGVEGLARWQHPQRGPVSPVVFVEVAERLGLAPMLDRWAISKGSADGTRLRHLVSPALRVAVNISAANLADATLEQHVAAVYGDVDAADRLLVLEITENALMQNPDAARATLERLHLGGVDAAIDDFGTGYSSLAYLSRLPVQSVKIDRSFIAKIVDDADARAITAAIIDLAATLGLRTVAEGVETVEQLALLRELGCWAAQGFLWSPAVPLERLGEIVAGLPGGRFPVT